MFGCIATPLSAIPAADNELLISERGQLGKVTELKPE